MADNKKQEVVTLEELKALAKRRKAEVDVKWEEQQEKKPEVVLEVLKEAIQQLQHREAKAVISKDGAVWRINGERPLSKVKLFTLGITADDFRRIIELIPEIKEADIEKQENGEPVIAIRFNNKEG